MEKVYKHRKTGELAYYKDGIFKQNNCSVEIGVEPSSEFWNEILFITEDGVEMFEGGVYYVPQRKDNKYDGFISIIAVSGGVYNSEIKRFASKQKMLEFIKDFNKEPILTTFDGVELFGGESIYSVTDDFQLCYTSIATKENIQGIRVFAKMENAQEYILMNKSLLSLNDLLSVWGSNVEMYKESILFKNFNNLAKTKL